MTHTIGQGRASMGRIRKDEVVDIRKTLATEPVLPLAKLSWEIGEIHLKRYAGVAERIFLSLNAAATAWHLHEWLWKTADDARRAHLLKITKADGKGMKPFSRAVQRWAPAIGICRQLATAQKHFSVEYDRSDVFFEVHQDDELDEYNVWLTINHNGAIHQDADVYLSALISWGRLYVAVGYPSAADVLAAAPEYFSPSRTLPR